MELSTRRGLDAFIEKLAPGVELILVLDCLALMGVYRDGTVNLLHWFFSVPYIPYSTDQRLMAFVGDLPRRNSPRR